MFLPVLYNLWDRVSVQALSSIAPGALIEYLGAITLDRILISTVGDSQHLDCNGNFVLGEIPRILG